MWLDPNFSLRWGPYFDTGADDEAKLTTAVIKAKSAGIILKRTAVERLAPFFGIENIDQYMEALEEAEEESETKALAMAEAMGESAGDGGEEKEGDDGPKSTPTPPESKPGLAKAKPKPFGK